MADSVGIESDVRYTPGVADTGYWARQEGARTPERFRIRVLGQFRSPENLRYLRQLFTERTPRGPLRQHILATLDDAVEEFSDFNGRAYDILMSDPTARRGVARRAVSLWQEVRRLNTAFFEDRQEFLIQNAGTIERREPRDGISDDDEQYAMRMFISDSLRPPGLEHLNTPGPLYALREDQSTYIPRAWAGNGSIPGAPMTARAFERREGFAGNRPPPGHNVVPTTASATQVFGPGGRFGGQQASVDSVSLDGIPVAMTRPRGWATPQTPVNSSQDFAGGPRDNGETDEYNFYLDDDPWSKGDPNRTPEQAVAEYQNDGKLQTDTLIGGTEIMGKTDGEMYAWGGQWQENGGTRFMRYESIPFWQQGGREGYDYDIEETLGTGARETDNPVRGWNMEILKNPRGQEYRMLGPRSGHIV